MKRDITTKMDDFLLGNISKNELLDFVNTNAIHLPDLNFEIELNNEINNSLVESEIIDLRNNLKEIIEMEQDAKSVSTFNLTKHLDTDKPDIYDSDENQELVGNTMEKIHIDNHNKILLEKTHNLHVDEIMESIHKNSQQSDDNIWPEIQIAMAETEVADLRQSIQNIIAENSASHNIKCADTISDTEIGNAILEKDVFELRSNLNRIIHSDLAYIEEDNNQKLDHQIAAAIQEDKVMQLRKSIKDMVHSTEFKNNESKLFIVKKVKPIRIIQSVAAIAAIFILGLFLFNQPSSDFDTIYSSKYIPYDASNINRAGTATEEIMTISVQLYRDGKYSESLNALNSIKGSSQEKPQFNFYAGLNYQGMGQYAEAIESYQKVITNNNNLFIEQSKWYMALCFLKTKNIEQAELALNSIAKNNGYFSKNAKDILKKIK